MAQPGVGERTDRQRGEQGAAIKFPLPFFIDPCRLIFYSDLKRIFLLTLTG